jgi:hypothetical protein
VGEHLVIQTRGDVLVGAGVAAAVGDRAMGPGDGRNLLPPGAQIASAAVDEDHRLAFALLEVGKRGPIDDHGRQALEPVGGRVEPDVGLLSNATALTSPPRTGRRTRRRGELDDAPPSASARARGFRSHAFVRRVRTDSGCTRRSRVEVSLPRDREGCPLAPLARVQIAQLAAAEKANRDVAAELYLHQDD